MLAPATRILLRYTAAALVTWGVLAPGMGDQIASDPDVIAVAQIGLGAAVAAGTELTYWAAKRWGWQT